ncbi:MAG: hypothetical protein WA908_13300 [Pontixanthobacter sp.]
MERPLNIVRILAILPAFVIACCAPAPAPAPTPQPVQQPIPAPTPPVAVVPQFENWLDAPQTPGDWRYVQEPGETLAVFGTGASDTQFAIVCRRASNVIGLVRPQAAQNTDQSVRPLIIRTETAERTVSAEPQSGPDPRLIAQLQPRDPLLDAMALSRGRFAVQTVGMPTLYLPAWPEVTRVIEDCR